MDTMTDQIIKATIVAANAHAGQKDKTGNEYIAHPFRVAMRVSDNNKPVALLHDVLEDTPLTVPDLEAFGFDRDIVTDVRCLSKRFEFPNETNREYHQRLLDTGSPRVLYVKHADLTDNLDTRRSTWVLPSEMRKKYVEFKSEIEKALGI